MSKCQESLEVGESFFFEEVGDWRQRYLDLLQHEMLLLNRTDALKVQRKSIRFFIEDGLLFRKGINQAPLRRTSGDEVATAFKEVHSRGCANIKGA